MSMGPIPHARALALLVARHGFSLARYPAFVGEPIWVVGQINVEGKMASLLVVPDIQSVMYELVEILGSNPDLTK